MRHAVIMAGGSGTRLWPLSRQTRPKQLLKLFAGQSLLRQSFDRLRDLLPAEQIHLIAGRSHGPAMLAELPEMPPGNFMAEPCGRDPANAVGLAAQLIARQDHEGTMGVFTADHIIRPVNIFRETVRKGFELAERYPDALVTFGIRPQSPHTGYGYIHRGRELEPGVFTCRQFKKKPAEPIARQYLASGEYYWNSGMFVWKLPTIIDQFRRHQPDLHAGLCEVAAGYHDPASTEVIDRIFSSLPKIAVDFAILEKADRVIVVEMPCEWLDVGSWSSLAEVFGTDSSGNTRAAEHVITLDAERNIFVSETDHLIAAIGIKDLVVVHSDNATLICRREDIQRIKEMVERIHASGGEAGL